MRPTGINVRELIDIISKLDPEMKVFIVSDGQGDWALQPDEIVIRKEWPDQQESNEALIIG